MKRLFPIVLLLAIPIAEASSAESGSRPNVILLLLDDAGWADVGSFGGRMQTPHVDQLAADGMRFNDCHSPAPNCSPSRAGILTGRIPARAGIYSYLPPGHPMHLRGEETTVAELARDAGYRTGHFGKWHLSELENDDQPGPLDQGFEYSLGTSNNASPSHRDPVNFARNGEPVGKTEGYSCQIVVDEAIGWIESVRGAAGKDDGGADDRGEEQQAADPFLACVWFHEPHTPIASPPEMIDAVRQREPGIGRRRATYLANLENVDVAVGRLLERLERLGIADDTVIWFTSDNGPLQAESRGPLRGVKSNVWEGGHRVPGVIRWPGRVAAGSECDVPVSGVDFLPTFCAMAGADLPGDREIELPGDREIELPGDREIDGVSLMPLLEGREDEFRRDTPLYWFFYRLNPSLAIRDGNWALVARTDDAERPKAHPLTREDMPRILESKPVSFRLFDLSEEIGQRSDRADDRPRRFSEMRRKMIGLHADVLRDAVEWEVPAEYRADARRRIWDSN